jgi:hypothetical protein
MSAATASIDVPEKLGDYVYLPLAANAILYSGVLAAVDASGNLNPASDTAGLAVIGRFEGPDTSNTGGAAGAMSGRVKRGIFGYQNAAGGNALTAASIGQALAYVYDDQTVGIAGGTAHTIIAGVVVDISDGYVWVDTRRKAL